MIINPGQLRHTISIYRYTETIDDEGFKIRDFKLIYKCKSFLEKHETKLNESNSGSKSTGISSNKTTISCVIRYVELTDKDLIEIKGVRYSISEIEDIDFKGRFLRITLTNG